jgi:hypothetical protein
MMLKTLVATGAALALLTTAAVAKPAHHKAPDPAPATPSGPIPYDQMKADDAKADAEKAAPKAKAHHKAKHHKKAAPAAPAADTPK